MKCPRCQHENQAGAKFCQECAAPLTRVCLNCGARLPADAKFCPECAHPVAQRAGTSARFGTPEHYTPKHLAERILLSKDALEGERKQVTILFADLKGSMELLADRDPEEARKLLDPVLEQMMEAVHRYEGTVNQVMGDGVMALFGAPLAQEDHAVRACYAALRMQDSVKRYAAEVFRTQGLTVRIRAGINSGEVVVRSIGSDLHMDYTAVGQTTHLAARMEQLADPGGTLITAETLRLAEGFVHVNARGRAPVKGLSELVEVFELTGAGSARTRVQAAAARGLTKFVGRDVELAQMFSALERSHNGHGQVVALVGEPGVGKSRLVWEFTHSHRIRDWSVLESGSVSYGKASAYRPLIDFLKNYFHVEERDDARRVREKIAGKLLMLDRQLEPTLPALLFLLEAPLVDTDWDRVDPAQKRLRMLEACRRLLLREAQVQPLVLVFEDLHWIDNETQAFLDSLVESLPTARLLLLVNYRPEYQHRWGAKTYYSQLRVDSLSPENADELLHALLGDDSSLLTLKKLLMERTEGNPLFLEESVRTLVETGALLGTRGAYRPSPTESALRVPATVQAIIASRIDRLSPDDKHLLQAAAVIGKDVPYPLLQAIAQLPEDELRQRLGDLQAAELLYETSLFPDPEYTFKHALTHEVGYASLLQEQRRIWHGRIVAAIEKSYAGRLGERVEQLAHHALRAELWDKAVEYLRQAGVKAFERSANRLAAASFEQALAAIEHLPQSQDVVERTVDLCLALRPCVTPLGDMKRVLAAARRAARLIASLDNPKRVAMVDCYQAGALTNLGRNKEALPLALRALSVAKSLNDPLLSVAAWFVLGMTQVRDGVFRDATESHEHERSLSPEGLLELMSGRSTGGTLEVRSAVTSHSFAKFECSFAYAELGAFDAAMERAGELEQIAQAIGLVYFHALAAVALGSVHLHRGESALAIPFLERGLKVGEDADFPAAIIHAACGLGHAYNLVQRSREGIATLERAWDLAEAGGFLHWGVICLMHLADAYSLTGEDSKARTTLNQALNVARDGGFRAREAWALYLQGCILGRGSQPDVASAQQATQAGLSLAHQLAMRPLEAQCELGLGQLSTQSGDRQNARLHLNSAAEIFRELNMQSWLEKTESALKAL